MKSMGSFISDIPRYHSTTSFWSTTFWDVVFPRSSNSIKMQPNTSNSFSFLLLQTCSYYHHKYGCYYPSYTYIPPACWCMSRKACYYLFAFPLMIEGYNTHFLLLNSFLGMYILFLLFFYLFYLPFIKKTLKICFHPFILMKRPCKDEMGTHRTFKVFTTCGTSFSQHNKRYSISY